jgi:hypothetical protein
MEELQMEKEETEVVVMSNLAKGELIEEKEVEETTDTVVQLKEGIVVKEENPILPVEEPKLITPTEYFKIVKDRRHTITDETLQNVYDVCLGLLNKDIKTGQTDAVKKLLFELETVEKELGIVRMGITTFIYRDDIEQYIENISDKVVKIIELSQYEREIPDEVAAIVESVKDKFDKLYIVFTDYTGEMEKKVAQERRDKDPILFGTFLELDKKNTTKRFYYLADWEDEYCHLTLDKLVIEMKAIKNENIVRTIKTPGDIVELKEQLRQLEKSKDGNSFFMKPEPQVKENILHHIMTFIGRK